MTILINNKLIESFIFAGGECQIKIDISNIGNSTEVLAYLNNSNDIMCLLLAVDAIRQVNKKTSIHLTIPYFPYARQDRVCNPGESFSLKVMAGLINNLKCVQVTIYDPHSNIILSLVENCRIISLADIVADSTLAQIILQKNLTLVSPDKGAKSKIQEVGKRLSSKAHNIEVFAASKVRESSSGKIISTEIHDDVRGKNLIIIDDICDGGRTFIELAKVLKNKGASKIYLYVTHGIFSQGLNVLKEDFKHVYCFHSMLDAKDVDQSFLTILQEKIIGEYYVHQPLNCN